MHNLLFLFATLALLGCSPKDSDGNTVGTDSGLVDTAEDTGTDTGTDTGATVPDWVDPVVPEGPIPGPEGTGTTPEDGEFDWSGVGQELIDSTLPMENFGFPRYIELFLESNR